MSANDIHGIESGWTVKSHDGNSVGTVEETTDAYMLVKDGLINASRHYLPAKHLAHVRPELKEVGIDLTQAEFTQGDWSEPPTEGPRWDVPISAEREADVPDPMRQPAREPEKPADI
ncbi:MAG: hypothetical protein ACXWWL_02905 [Candidatus Limnocylindria bacterium]